MPIQVFNVNITVAPAIRPLDLGSDSDHLKFHNNLYCSYVESPMCMANLSMACKLNVQDSRYLNHACKIRQLCLNQ